MPTLAVVRGAAHVQNASHLREWCDRLERHRVTVTVAPRGFLKSTLLGAYLAWRLRVLEGEDFRGIYFSAKRELAMEQLRDHKAMIDALVENGHLPDVESGTQAASVITYYKGQYEFRVVPEGIFAASRGYHVDVMLLDDVLKDPHNPLVPTEIEKVNRIFRQKIIPMVRDRRTSIHIIGTPIAEGDLLDQLRSLPKDLVSYGVYPAILEDGRPLWPEKYPLEFLERLRALQQDPQAFDIEYMVKPAQLGQSYITRALYEEALRWE